MSESPPCVWQRIEQRAKTDEAYRSISIIALVLTGLREFLTMRARFEAETPREVLDQIEAERSWIEQNAPKYPAIPIQEMRHHLDAREVALYNTLLPNELRQAAADAIPSDTTYRYADLLRAALAPASDEQVAASEKVRVIAADPEFISRYLEQLRRQLSDSKVLDCLNRPLGIEWTRDRQKTEGMSIKNWPVVGVHIWEVYQLLLPLYPSKPRISRSMRSGLSLQQAAFPQELLIDLVELFKTEFPDALSDLTEDDAQSRIQYRLRSNRSE